jgi:radical SAM superfamily enzyme YgiQ (UPF0313 family)
VYEKLRLSRGPALLLIQPPVYDFALFDLFFKPYGLLRIGRWFAESGYEITFVNGLDYRDRETKRSLGPVRRKRTGTGKFHRLPLRLDEELPGAAETASAFGEFRRDYAARTGRYISRYGILPESFRRQIAAARPDLVFVSSQMTYWYPGVAETVRTVKELYPGVPIVVGGTYATLLPEHCRKVCGADYAFRGKIEEEMEGPDNLDGFLIERGLPLPAGKIPPDPLLISGVWEDAGVIRLNRGCPFRCAYCASALIEPHFSAGDGERLWEQVKEMHGRFGTRNFAFYDDALLEKKEQALLPFLEAAIRAENTFSFYLPNAVHLRHIDAETARLLRRAGFQEVRLGYESADEQSLAVGAKHRSGEAGKAVESLLAAGFAPGSITLYILAGLPGQTSGEVEETLSRAERLAVRLSIAEYSPVPGTALWEASLQGSVYPLAEEPLFQNNTILPLQWEGLNYEDLERFKRMAKRMSP